MTDVEPYRHRFSMNIIQHAIWLYHRFPLSYRDVQELLHQRGIEVNHETLREWCIKFSPLIAKELRQWEPSRGSRRLLWTRSARRGMASDTGYGGRWTSTASCSTYCSNGIAILRPPNCSSPGSWVNLTFQKSFTPIN